MKLECKRISSGTAIFSLSYSFMIKVHHIAFACREPTPICFAILTIKCTEYVQHIVLNCHEKDKTSRI